MRSKADFETFLRDHLGFGVRQLLEQIETISPGLASPEVTQSLICILEAAISVVAIMGAAAPSAKAIGEARSKLARAYTQLQSLERKLGLN